MIAGREQTIGAAMAIEREHLLPLPGSGRIRSGGGLVSESQWQRQGERVDELLFGAAARRGPASRPRRTPPMWRSGMTASAWRGTSGASAGSRRA